MKNMLENYVIIKFKVKKEYNCTDHNSRVYYYVNECNRLYILYITCINSYWTKNDLLHWVNTRYRPTYLLSNFK